MEKDIHVLLETTNDEIFEEQAKHWPGVEIFRQYAWKCVCDDPDCFRFCLQKFASQFPSVDVFVEYLGSILDIDSREGLDEYTSSEWKRHRDLDDSPSQTMH